MGELIIPVAMLLLGVIFYRESGLLPIKEGYPMTSATYPRFLAVLLMACAVILLVKVALKWKACCEAEKGKPFDIRIFAAFAGLLLFYLGVPYVGYIMGGIFFLIVLSLLLQKGKPRILDTVVLPACLSLGMYFAFQFMSIYLPVGSLFKSLF